MSRMNSSTAQGFATCGKVMKCNLAASLLVAIGVALPASAATLRIMPLGDSITEAVGWEAGSGYRAVLRQLLTDAGYEVDYVGDTTKNPGGFSNTAISNPTTDDCQHSGHGGWRVNDTSVGVREHLPGWFRTVEDPHVILLHLGTNDLSANWNDQTLISRYDALLDELSAYQPSAKIIATTLLPRYPDMDDNHMKPYFNNLLEDHVAAHVAKGQHVYFLDMYSKLVQGNPENGGDFPDQLHPNEAGFRKMAQAWFEKIQEIQPVEAAIPETELAAVDAALESDHQSITFYFNKTVGDDATNLTHYVVSSGAFTPAAATLSANRRAVTVRGSAPVAPAVPCELTVSGVPSESGSKTLYAAKTVTLTYMPYGAQYYVPEAGLYRKVYELDIPSTPNYENGIPSYSFNDSENVGPFSRIAYYLELQGGDGQLYYAWASMDAFTNDAAKIAVPTRSTGVTFQQYVDNLKVYSNVEGVPNGERGRGNIEFWPWNYTKGTSLGVAGASGSDYDVDDTMSANGNYGSMQIHDSSSRTPVICFNKWGGSDSGKSACLGIGVSSLANHTDSKDWTFAENAGSWSKRRTLQIFVMESTEPVPAPQAVSAQITTSGRQIFVAFDSPIADVPDLSSRFSLSDGTRIWSATRIAGDPRRVVLATNTVKNPSETTLSYAGIASDTPSRTEGSGTLALTGLRPPSVDGNVPAALRKGYEFIYQIDLPTASQWTSVGYPVYTVQDSIVMPFDRVAYYVETVSNAGATNWVWLSFDKYTAGASTDEIAFPYRNAGATGRFVLGNLEYASNIEAIQNLTGTSGIAELTGGNYKANLADASQGGSNSDYDWNDTLESGDGHGCFQFFELHEEGGATNGVPLVCINGWSTSEPSIAIGLGPNDGGEHFDWTFAHNAGAFSVRRVCAFVRPCEEEEVSFAPPAQIVERVYAAKDYEHLYTVKLFQGMKINNGDGSGMAKDVAGYAAAHPVDNSAALAGKVDYLRVGYFVELVKTDGTTNWVWTAFDRFSERTDFQEIDIPVVGTIVQRNVANLDVDSNVSGIVTGTGIATGNIEFWPYNYSQGNAKSVPSADGGKFDFGDTCKANDGSHGSWQVHNYGASQTLWAVNKFNGHGDGLAVGIGNCTTSSDPDYTFDKSASNYTSMNVYVLIKPDPNSEYVVDPDANNTVYRPFRAVVSEDLNSVCLTFKDSLDPYAADPKFFKVDGVQPADAAVSAIDGRDMILTLAQPIAPGVSHSVTTHFPKGTNGTFAFELPRGASSDIVAGVDEFSDYMLVQDLTVGTQVNYSANGADYRTDLSRFLANYPFDRVAVSLELEASSGGERKWVWVSMDAYTDDLAKLGMPTVLRRNIFAQYVQNLKVYASENAGVKTGEWPDGNIEITPSNYTPENALGIPGADGGVYDFGDTISGNGSEAGHGCFQIHNYRERETVITVSQTGKNVAPGIGIGNFPPTGSGSNSPSTDGTFSNTAGSYSVREFKVYVRPETITENCGYGPQFLVQPQGRVFTPSQVAVPQTVELSVYSPSAARYQWRRNGVAIPGATGATLSVTVAEDSKPAVYDVIAFIDGANYTISDPAVVKVLYGFFILLR